MGSWLSRFCTMLLPPIVKPLIRYSALFSRSGQAPLARRDPSGDGRPGSIPPAHTSSQSVLPILSCSLIPGRYPLSANPARFTGGYGIVRGMAREMAWVQLFCRGSGCGTMFYICGSCYRGQVYCGERCRRRMRRQQMRLANRKHQDSPEGRLDHRDRQRVYRAKCRLRRVTDHTFARRLRSVNIKKPWTKPRRRPPFGEAFQPRRRLKRSQTAIRAVCIVCGRMRR